MMCSASYGASKAIDGNSVNMDTSATSASSAQSVRAPALVGMQIRLDRAYDDVVAVQVPWHSPAGHMHMCAARTALTWSMHGAGCCCTWTLLRWPCAGLG